MTNVFSYNVPQQYSPTFANGPSPAAFVSDVAASFGSTLGDLPIKFGSTLADLPLKFASAFGTFDWVIPTVIGGFLLYYLVERFTHATPRSLLKAVPMVGRYA
jgi:hypothetical protein